MPEGILLFGAGVHSFCPKAVNWLIDWIIVSNKVNKNFEYLWTLNSDKNNIKPNMIPYYLIGK